MEETEYLKCKFIARLDDQTYHDVRVMVEECMPRDCIWGLAINECAKFKSPLQQLSFVEEVTVKCSTAYQYNIELNKED